MAAMNLSREQQNELLFVGFNQDYGCFACGTDTGFRIYNCDPFKETFRRDFSSGGIGIVEMLFRCNILAIVGGGRNPRYPPNKVMIWDDHQSRNIGELSFRSEVKAVKLRRDRVVVVLQNKIYVYNFADLKLLDHIETIANPKGLVALCPSSTNTVLACPGVSRGTVRIELYDQRKTTLITAHEADLSQMCLNLEGTRLATASDKGTLIRIFDTQSGQLTQELRRGADKAEIYSVCFSPNSQYLACSSDKHTVHIFALTKEGGGADGAAPLSTSAHRNSQTGQRYSSGSLTQSTPISREDDSTENSKSNFSFMRGLLPKYFSSEWSFAQFRVPETRTICAFGVDKNTIIVVGADGSFYKAVFDANGECERTSYSKFIQAEDDE
ncbi:hypothetical protein SPRG_08852 [Saprolegnia parasitica CBS 223.65]|uniref:WD repeat domain phosphoinositide-interacting protein 3 n=1 Tax=Saprolegnia parasitica (strain CBS 223.65) TaxID=695850 RepID=A0A067CH88_SAPPC|nr:hypothetical protein SPRG_08852 [Saprolegnia parasitica CBS 223.65]KDO25911.1 hypothetical protein SPRG_08852 [Saprolegnia parasitica CBS 223.65]|eukprot:XP_012203471.1 hypothetical protein SPRG_08852 [Saprolegnia parasitica CBS 223.65]